MEANLFVNGLLLLSGLAFLGIWEEKRKFARRIGWVLVLILLMTVTNPIFSHNGKTPLFYMNGQAITAEAMIYGLHIGLMMAGILCWFNIWEQTVDSDKQMYLLGLLTPSLALLLSMILKMIPGMRRQYQSMKEAHAGLLGEKRDLVDKISVSLKLFMGLVSWTLEQMQWTGLSMKARGYGAKGRTHYTYFRFRKRDLAELIFVLFPLVAAGILRLTVGKTMYYYPVCSLPMGGGMPGYYSLVLIGGMVPLIMEGGSRIRWHIYKSKI